MLAVIFPYLLIALAHFVWSTEGIIASWRTTDPGFREPVLPQPLRLSKVSIINKMNTVQMYDSRKMTAIISNYDDDYNYEWFFRKILSLCDIDHNNCDQMVPINIDNYDEDRYNDDDDDCIMMLSSFFGTWSFCFFFVVQPENTINKLFSQYTPFSNSLGSRHNGFKSRLNLILCISSLELKPFHVYIQANSRQVHWKVFKLRTSDVAVSSWL